MKKYLAVLFLALAVLSVSVEAQTAPKPKPKHALAKIAQVAVAPVVHPKRSIKAIFGSVLFGVEAGNDVVLAVSTEADKAFDAISVNGAIPVLSEVYAVVGQVQKDSGKLDTHLEKWIQELFGVAK